jgi:hypothetical protein
MKLEGGRQGFIPGRNILEGVMFIVYNQLLTTSLIFLTRLLIMCLKLNKYAALLLRRAITKKLSKNEVLMSYC